MLAAEDDLIDAYARGELSGEERRQFEKHFLSSVDGRKRVQFARAFAGTVPGTERSRFQTWRVAQIATAAAVIVLAVILSWLVLDRRRIKNELNALRAENAELKQSANSEPIRTAEIAERPNDRREQRDQPAKWPGRRNKIRRVRQLPTTKSQTAEVPVKKDDTILGNNFVSRQITQLPLEGRNVVNLLTLQPGITRDGSVTGARADQASVILDGVDANEEKNALTVRQTLVSLPGSHARGSSPITIEVKSEWIRFRLLLDKSAKHTDHRITIKTADGRRITTLDWNETLTPDQNSLDTPAIPTNDLSSGDYQLTLGGKEPDGSFVQVEHYTFKIIKK